MEYEEFISSLSNEYLTLKDILCLREGEQFEVVVWDRNLCDSVANRAKDGILQPKVLYDAFFFFEQERAIVTWRGNFEWDISFANCDWETIRYPVDLDVSSISAEYEFYPLAPDGWMSLEEKRICYSEFLDSTPVGWRGPMMRWSKLFNRMKVYHNI